MAAQRRFVQARRGNGHQATRGQVRAGAQRAGQSGHVGRRGAGLAGLTVPAEYGGQGLTRRHQEIFNEEAVDFYLPIGLYTITIGMCIPVLLEHGTGEQRRRHIANMLAGHEIWCQMFSEPNAGSDVASLQMRALRDGDEWIINGQKVWTSSAHYASYGMCVTRTDVNLPKHKGLTMMIVPMNPPAPIPKRLARKPPISAPTRPTMISPTIP